MKKKFFVLILITVGLLFFSVASAVVWPLSSTPSLNITMPSGYEPSGLVYNEVTKKLFAVSDKGQITMMNLDGTSQVTKSAGGDNEAITIVDPNSSKVYIGIEQPDSIIQFDINTGIKEKTWDLSSVMTGADNSGLEGLTFVPNGYHPFPSSSSGGIFYAGIQRAPVPGGAINDDYLIYAFDIDLNSTGTIGKVVQWWGIPVVAGTPNSDVSDLYFSKETGVLYVLYDGYDRLIEMTTDGKVIKDYSGIPLATDEQEGVLVLPNNPYSSTKTADIYFAYDHLVKSSGISKFPGYEVNFDVDGDGVMNNVDCAVNDKTLSTKKIYYQDLDGDGLGSDVTISVCSLTPPTGYVANSDDLDDNDYYNDNDRDDDGIPAGVDCNDNDKNVWENKIYYKDADGDGVGTGIPESFCLSIPPAGYVSNANIDCNDNDKTVFTKQSYYKDADGDGVGSGVLENICASVAPAGYVSNSSVDCNDNDKTVSTLQTYYKDADGDTLGFGTSELFCKSTPPAGYVTNALDKNDNDFDNDNVITSQDCDDKDVTVWQTKTYYKDMDGDGVGTGIAENLCKVTAPAGYVSNSSVDCNDNDKTVSTLQTYYKDADGDTLGFGTSELFCKSTPPAGYVTNALDKNDNDFDNDNVITSLDCNDKDNTVWNIQTYYKDSDGDKHGTGIAEGFCLASAPAGYVSTADVDCNDNDPIVFANQTYYKDADGDGKGFGPAQSFCSLVPPAGYVNNANDLNDTDFDNDGISTVADCNDHDATLSFMKTFYQDLDKDGLGSDVTVSVCSLTPPSGYVTNSDDLNDNSVVTDLDNDGVLAGVDCNDNDPLLTVLIVYYRDADGDGKGLASKTKSVCSLTPPVGYVADSSDKNDNDYDNDGYSTAKDCNDKNPLYHVKKIYFRDKDGDGLGCWWQIGYFCVPPSGYVLNSKDKNDNHYDG